jgi:hypothetical protein
MVRVTNTLAYCREVDIKHNVPRVYIETGGGEVATAFSSTTFSITALSMKDI